MTADKALEYRITRQLLRRGQRTPAKGKGRTVDRLITCVAVSAALLLMGSYLQELLWAVLAGCTVLTLGSRSD